MLNELHNIAIRRKRNIEYKMHKIPIGWQKTTLCGLKVNSARWEGFVGNCTPDYVFCERCTKIMEKYKGN